MKSGGGRLENWEALARELYSFLENGKKLIAAFAPTGFGKTMSSPYLLALARGGCLASRLVHVVPTRALLRQIYREKFVEACRKLGLRAAYQSADRIPGGSKSPYFLADLVVTTLESFLLNTYKLPPSEITKILEGRSEGHYYPSIAALAPSIIVMDEAHIYLGDPGGENSASLVASALAALSRIGVPVVLESATMPLRLLESFVGNANLRREDVGVVYVCRGGSANACPQVEKLADAGFETRILPGDPGASPAWVTRVLDRRDEALRTAGELCRDRLVLFVSNTVRRAVEAYQSLRGRCDAVLAHSLLTEADKEAAEKRMVDLREEGRGLVVASPVVDVGVEVDAEVLITEPAPVENLAQRVGRLCRSRGRCKEAEVLIVGDPSLSGPFSEELTDFALKEVSRELDIEWRLPWDGERGRTYVRILEMASSVLPDAYVVPVYEVLERIVEQDARPLDMVDKLAAKFKGLSLVKAAVGWPSGVESLEAGNYVLTDLETLKRLGLEKECLERVGERLALAAVVRAGRSLEVKRCASGIILGAIRRGMLSASDARYLRRELAECLDEGEHLVDYFMVVKPECYQAEVGPRVS